GYDADLEQRLSVAIGHHVPLLQLAGHLRTVYFGGLDLPRWSLENPAANPLTRITRHLPDMRNEPGSRPVPWTQRGLHPQDYDWVPPEQSVQWRAFRRLVARLRSRGNDVLVLVGPINRHMMTPHARQGYEALEAFCRIWLTEQGIPHVIPELLPSALYCDASHPLAAGYARLAQDLLRDPGFLAWISTPNPPSAPSALDAHPRHQQTAHPLISAQDELTCLRQEGKPLLLVR
ncbi:MAG: hypothetical protein K9N49_03045, partial [Candidatus Marinimicrobia bacterium]|nr:hypothetical protein [Candidatus Neomarinimicrobiota bacterium]